MRALPEISMFVIVCVCEPLTSRRMYCICVCIIEKALRGGTVRQEG